MPGFTPRVAVDVGANSGKSTIEIADAVEGVQVYSFEPVQKSYDLLAEAASARDNIVAERLALGSYEGQVYVTARGTSNSNHIIVGEDLPRSSELVTITRGETYFLQQGVTEIDYIKTNTNGWDLDVLVGFGSFLFGRKTRVLQVTCALAAGTGACSVQEFLGFLTPIGYGVIGIVAPVRMQPDGNAAPVILTADFLFALV